MWGFPSPRPTTNDDSSPLSFLVTMAVVVVRGDLKRHILRGSLLLGLSLFVLVTQNEVKLDLSESQTTIAVVVTKSINNKESALSSSHVSTLSAPPVATALLPKTSKVPEQEESATTAVPMNEESQHDADQPKTTTTATTKPIVNASFASDVAQCEDPTESPLDQCDLSTTTRGIPLLWIGNPRVRNARSWDTLTSLTSSAIDSSSDDQQPQPQGFVEAFGAKSISEMRGLNEHANEPGHCWIVRVLCQLQWQNMHDDDASIRGKPKSAIFGTLWNPYLGALKHK